MHKSSQLQKKTEGVVNKEKPTKKEGSKTVEKNLYSECRKV